MIGFTKTWGDRYFIPYTVFSSDAEVTTFPQVKIQQILYQNEYNSAVNIFKKCFGDRISDEEISDMPVYDAEVLKTFQTKMTICVVIAIISSVNITALFKYVIDLRRKTMAIFRINGCSKNRLKGIMVSEMMIYSAINILLCISCFNFLILPGLAGILPYVTLAYSVKTIFYLQRST